jgi:hypothetical protein
MTAMLQQSGLVPVSGLQSYAVIKTPDSLHSPCCKVCFSARHVLEQLLQIYSKDATNSTHVVSSVLI